MISVSAAMADVSFEVKACLLPGTPNNPTLALGVSSAD
jgi:hypothetical protein